MKVLKRIRRAVELRVIARSLKTVEVELKGTHNLQSVIYRKCRASECQVVGETPIFRQLVYYGGVSSIGIGYTQEREEEHISQLLPIFDRTS